MEERIPTRPADATVNQDIIGKNQEVSEKSGMFLGLPFQNMNDVINNLE